MKTYPKIVFKQMPLELETEMFLNFLDRDWSPAIINKYPQFQKIKDIKLKKDREVAIKNEIIKIRTELGGKLDKSLETIKSNWEKVSKKVFVLMSEIIQEEWLDKEIIAHVSINPVCPRFLDSWSFSVEAGSEYSNLIICHEISHFLFFKKLKKEFSEIKRQNYDSPHKEWILSEIIAVIVLNDPRMTKIIGPGGNFYPKHKVLKIGDNFLTQIIQDLYNEFVIKKKDFSKFIKESLEVIYSSK